MTDNEFFSILSDLKAYLASKKTFIENPFRVREFENAVHIARKLFPDAKIEIKDDPLQMGAMIFAIEDYDLDVSGETEINLFAEMTAKADNFETYPTDNGSVRLAVLFQNVLVRV